MTDAGEKLAVRVKRMIGEGMFTADMIRAELERAAEMLENCADATVNCAQKSVAQYVLRRGAAAIRRRKV